MKFLFNISSIFVIVLAFQYRFEVGHDIFSTISLFDLFLIASVPILFVRILKNSRLAIKKHMFLFILFLNLFFSVSSLFWSESVGSTIIEIIKQIYLIYIYILALTLFANPKSTSPMRALIFLFCLLVIGSLGFYLNVPGFGLYELKIFPDDVHLYRSSHARLSNPFVGRAPEYGPVLLFLGITIGTLGSVYQSKLASRTSILSYLMVALTLTRGVLLSLLISLTSLALIRRPGLIRLFVKSVFYMIILAAIISILVLVDLNRDIGDRLNLIDVIFSDRFSLQNVYSRLDLTLLYWAKIVDRPLLGYGSGVFIGNDARGEMIAAHNSVLQIFMSFGLLGGFLLIFVALSYVSLLIFSKSSNNNVRKLKQGLGVGILSIFLCSLTQPTLESLTVRIFSIVIIALYQQVIIETEKYHG